MTITEQINALKWNRDRVELWFKLGLHPKWGLSSELLQLMYQLYADASGDEQYNGRWNCGACQDTIYRKLGDFLNYGDNIGKPLLNWEAPKKEKKRKTDENGTEPGGKLD